MVIRRYQPGETIVLREMWEGKIWAAYPCRVVQDTPELLVVYRPVGTVAKRHTSLSGGEARGHERKTKAWVLKDHTNYHGTFMIKLAIPGETYSIIAFWNNENNVFSHWYINLESRTQRRDHHIDYTDLILDLIIQPNLKDWHWDDEDELKEAVELGIVSPEKAKELYAKGAQVRDLIMTGKSIFNGWEKWRPDPNWKIPVLPEGWDVIDT
ncbi:MAG: DUF402 domain-containing protein [Dehalococcoidales bacterium]|nr:DUF402 domain-containing protein [Dehalococcoidales bacterium]